MYGFHHYDYKLMHIEGGFSKAYKEKGVSQFYQEEG